MARSFKRSAAIAPLFSPFTLQTSPFLLRSLPSFSDGHPVPAGFQSTGILPAVPTAFFVGPKPSEPWPKRRHRAEQGGRPARQLHSRHRRFVFTSLTPLSLLSPDLFSQGRLHSVQPKQIALCFARIWNSKQGHPDLR